MGSDPRTLAHLMAQAGGAGALVTRPMFGEHGLYLDGRLVALLRVTAAELPPPRPRQAKRVTSSPSP